MEELLLARLKPATLLKETLLSGCFSRFYNYTNGPKSRKACQMAFDELKAQSKYYYLNREELVEPKQV